MTEVVGHIEELCPAVRGQIHISGSPIPIYPWLDDSRLRGLVDDLPRTPLRAGIEKTVKLFQLLKSEDRLDMTELEAR
jgi:hypothetical protein